MQSQKKDQEIEYEIQNKDLNAPRLTPAHIDSQIKEIRYHIADGTTTTICSLILMNGFVVNGESACVSLENFDADLAKRIAFDNAREKIWLMEGYLLKQKLYEKEQLNAR